MRPTFIHLVVLPAVCLIIGMAVITQALDYMMASAGQTESRAYASTVSVH